MIARAARLLLRLLPPGTVVRVLRGPLRGLRWVIGTAPHGAWLGRLEPASLALFARAIAPGATVWDIGANVGLFTLAAARAAGPAGRVVAFEPFPDNVAALKRHLHLNAVTNVEVVEAAVGREAGRARMAAGDSLSEARLAADGAVEVPVVSLDGWAGAGRADPPSVVKIDVEGAEFDVLRGAGAALAHRPLILMSIHSDELARRCLGWLTAAGYQVEGVGGERVRDTSEWVARAAATHSAGRG
jgi:FkbM family methyltransferase